MWARDVGRGIMELCRAGLLDAAGDAVEFIMQNGLNIGNRYGRVLCDINVPVLPEAHSYEIDGNVNVLMGIYSYWWYNGHKKDSAGRYLDNADKVFGWFEELGEKCPYGFLLPSRSELSGNPDTPFLVCSIYATYGAVWVLRAYEYMAKESGDYGRIERYSALAERFEQGMLQNLVSEGPHTLQNTKTPAVVWINGLDESNGTAAEIGDFGPRFFIHRWTRQLPFVLDFDRYSETADSGILGNINEASYRYIRDGMAEGYFFRRHGFVSCTCFGGMGDRHDDTMAGYGQNLFTQAALLSDDVNVYTKCIDGILCRLACDGDIVQPLTTDLNPWVMHECFTYENYEQGLDHTFGRVGDDSRFIMHNPGDEGNLVQSSETLKTFAIMAGITSVGDRLNIKPRLPWECTKAQVLDFPAVAPDGSLSRISYEFVANRWKNEFVLEITGTEGFSDVAVRIGPMPRILCNEDQFKEEWNIVRHHQASFAERIIPTNGRNKINITLINER